MTCGSTAYGWIGLTIDRYDLVGITAKISIAIVPFRCNEVRWYIVHMSCAQILYAYTRVNIKIILYIYISFIPLIKNTGTFKYIIPHSDFCCATPTLLLVHIARLALLSRLDIYIIRSRDCLTLLPHLGIIMSLLV